jgi:hypothetical protein
MTRHEWKWSQHESSSEAQTRARLFRDPGGRSALGPGRRQFPCPTCGRPNRLTAGDVARGYQCDACADRDEGGGF